MRHLRLVFSKLQEHQLYMKQYKCTFSRREVAYLGHVILADGIALDAQKVCTVLEWPVQRSVQAVRAFLGLAGYYRRFVRDYDDIVIPLTCPLRKDRFRWDQEAESTFRALQQALTTTPVLQLPDFAKEFVVECDALGSGFDAVLHQGTGPIAFFNHLITAHHAKLDAYKRELIGLVQAVRHWRSYLWGCTFLIKSNNYSLKFLLDQRLSTIPQHQWVSKLLDFDFRIEYKSGASNFVVDALSHHDTEESATLLMLSKPMFQLFTDLRREYEDDA
jgi:hypothetical protein